MSPYKNNIPSFLHPMGVIIYFLVLATMAMAWTNPLYLSALWIVVLSGIMAARAVKKWRHAMSMALWMVFFILLVNMIVSRSGQTILWESPRLPFLGLLSISKESILFGLNMGFKLGLIISIFILYEVLMPAHKSFSFFSKFTPKSALTLILAALFVPQLKRRLSEVSLVMKIRGGEFDRGSYLAKLRARYPLLKIMLVSSLEDSWQIAEALHMRSFGAGKRTYFTKDQWHRGDTLILSFALFSLAGFIYGLISKKGFLEFYPTVGKIIQGNDWFFISWIGIGLIILPVIMFGKK